ncbi:MAG: hypothetical protein AABZ47_00865 [Planctomycetota bacterium]
MNGRNIIIQRGLFALACGIAVSATNPAQADTNEKIVLIQYTGVANAAGQILLDIVPRGNACGVGSIASHNAAYVNLTTGVQLRNLHETGLGSPPGFTITRENDGFLKIHAKIAPGENFDVCADGQKIAQGGVGGLGMYAENGLSLQTTDKSKRRVPAVSTIGLGVLVVLVTAGGAWLFRKHRMNPVVN